MRNYTIIQNLKNASSDLSFIRLRMDYINILEQKLAFVQYHNKQVMDSVINIVLKRYFISTSKLVNVSDILLLLIGIAFTCRNHLKVTI